MQLSIRISGGNTTPAARRSLAETVESTLSKFGSHLQRATISVTDVNGPRGGKDKQCRCVLYMNRMKPVIIDELDFSVGGAIHHALERAMYAVSQRVARRKSGLGAQQRQPWSAPAQP